MQPQERLLHDVLGLADAAEHPVGDREQQRAQLLVRVGCHGRGGHLVSGVEVDSKETNHADLHRRRNGAVGQPLARRLAAAGHEVTGMTRTPEKAALVSTAARRSGMRRRAGPGADMHVLHTLIAGGFVPVIACIGLGRDGRLFNVNADTFAGHLAARLGARRLVIAGTTPGVLDAGGATLPVLDADGGRAAGRATARRRPA